MGLEKASISWSAKQLKKMIAGGKIDFDHIIQRSFVWERTRRSALIESMIKGYPIPPVFAKRFDDGSGKRNNSVYSIMDGKQRLSTIAQYLDDKFALSSLPPVSYIDSTEDPEGIETEIDISGKKFSELPEEIQDVLNGVIISVIYFDNLTPEEERELFKRLNAGKPLSTKSRLLASCHNIERLLDIGSCDLFEEMLTEKSRDNKNQVTLVMKAWLMLNKPVEEISFESKNFNPLLETAEISDEERYVLDDVFALIRDTHLALVENEQKAIAKKLYTEVHLISLVPYFNKAIKSSIEADKMAEWLVDFFDNHDEAYDIAATTGSAKNASVVSRDKVLSESFDQFFAEE